MDTRIDEVAAGVYRISTYTDAGPAGGLTFNQFLIDADEPMLVHTGMRAHAAEVLTAAGRVMPPRRVRWVTSNHASRPDEFGALDAWFAASPSAEVTHGQVGCAVNLADVSTRPLRPVADGERVDLGGRQVRWLTTPHIPGPWEAGIWVEEVTGVMFCGDLFAQGGQAPPCTEADILEPALHHDRLVHGTALTPTTGPTLRRLADERPEALALMHGPTFRGDTAAALVGLAEAFEGQLAQQQNPS